MGKIKGKKGKGKNKVEMPSLNTMQTNPAYNLSLSGGSRPPDWNKILTKREPIMSDEEFEKEIKALAVEYAEKSIEIGNSGKSASIINNELFKLAREYEEKKYNLQTPYVSVVSPDRKAAFAASDGYEVLGNEKNYSGTNRLMLWRPDGWTISPTNAEIERIGKFNNIFADTITAYETELGTKIPSTTISKVVAPLRNYL